VRHTRSNHEVSRTYRRSACRSAALIAVGLWLGTLSSSGPAQDLAQSIKQPWSLYLFVSTNMPRESMRSLAREAVQAGAVLVLRGFPVATPTLAGAQSFVAQLDAECCGLQPGRAAATPETASTVPSWSIDPKLFQQFGVTAVPAFVLVRTGSHREEDFCEVEGDMALANALKFFAQKSKSQAIRQQASLVYTRAFGGRS